MDGTEQDELYCKRYVASRSGSSAIIIVADTPYLGEMDKTKITGDKNVDAVQDGVNEGVTGQLGKGGLLEGVGNLTSKEVLTRGERGGKNESGKPGL